MYKVLMIPINLLSNTISDVFKQKATKDYNRLGNCMDIFISTFKKLILIGIIPFSLLGVFAPDIFSFIFGEKWKIAGEFAQIMTPMLFLKFVINPLSYTFYIAQKQHLDLIGQVVLFLFVSISIFIGLEFNNAEILLISFSISYSIMYILYLSFSYKYSKGNKID